MSETAGREATACERGRVSSTTYIIPHHVTNSYNTTTSDILQVIYNNLYATSFIL